MSSLFNCIRGKSQEKEAEKPIRLEIDQCGAFDYERGEDVKYSLEDYTGMIEKQISKFSSLD